MNRKSTLCIVAAALFFVEIHAQDIIRSGKIGTFDGTPIKNLDEVNAWVFKPAGYNTVENPRLPDSLSNFGMLSREERAEMHKKRVHFNPYLIFGGPVELRKGDIFVGYSSSWIRLSAYYQHNQDNSSVEEYRTRVNQNILGKNLIDYSPDFELLENVGNPFKTVINADTVFIYDTKWKYKFKDTVDNYGCLVVHLVKFDLGYVSLRYYYPLDKREAALSEISNTWGIVRFKPDREFTHPNHENWTPRREEPDLYLGKFSFLNDPEQVKRENDQYEQRKPKGQANSLAMEGLRLARAKDINQAKEKLMEALTIDTNNAIAYRHLLLISLDEDNRNDSWKIWNRLLEKDPKNIETWFLKGLLQKRYNELDSAATTFERIVGEKDSLHFRSFIELALVYAQKGERDAADVNFNRAITVFTTEGEKSLRRESHRMFNINDLFMTRLAYARFLMANSEFEKSKALFEQTLKDEATSIEAGMKGERQRIYGKLTPASLGELNFMLAMSYAGLHDEVNTRLYLEKAKSFGKVLPEPQR